MTRSREQILTEWDAIRKMIVRQAAYGHTNDAPRLWLEGVFDDVVDAAANAREASAVTRVLAEVGGHPEISGPASTTGAMWEAVFTLHYRTVPERYLLVAVAAQIVAEIVRRDQTAAEPAP